MVRSCVRFVVVASLACGGASPPPKPAEPAPPAAAAPAAPAAPAVTAEARFTAWIAAFNAGDTAGLTAFKEHLTPDVAKDYPDAEVLLGFRDSVGGFEIRKPEEATPAKDRLPLP